VSRWVRIRESFWFLPGLLCVLGAVLAEVLIYVDRRVGEADFGPFSVLINRVGASGSRDLLGAIAGSMLTVAATTFSITIAVLATASAAYGPRLVRNFMTDRGNQFVLGVFVATFLYSLLVLRSIARSDNSTAETFVPQLAVSMAVLFALLAIGVLVYFINHISDSVQIWTLARQVRTELTDSIVRLYPEEIDRAPVEVEEARGPGDVPVGLDADGVPVRSGSTGYVQNVSEDRLLALAERRDVLVALRVRPGSHTLDGGVVAVLWPPDRVDDELLRTMRDNIVVEQARSPHQDVDFAVLILEEMAVRALSPSTNDPYTALNALDDLAAALVLLAARSSPSPYRYDGHGKLRVLAPRVVLTDLLDRVFDAMRCYAVKHPTVLRRTLELAEQVGAASREAAVHARLTVHVKHIVEAYTRSSPQECDLDRLREQAAQIQQALATASA